MKIWSKQNYGSDSNVIKITIICNKYVFNFISKTIDELYIACVNSWYKRRGKREKGVKGNKKEIEINKKGKSR